MPELDPELEKRLQKEFENMPGHYRYMRKGQR